MSEYYVLDERNDLVPVADYKDFYAWLDKRREADGQDKPTATLQVARDVLGDVTVSTVFLGLDHGWGEDAPVTFETMVFGGHLDENMWRYATWDQATAGHARVVTAVQNGTNPDE